MCVLEAGKVRREVRPQSRLLRMLEVPLGRALVAAPDAQAGSATRAAG